MNNGDRLTGEIKGLDSGTLSVSFDYILGTASLDWSKVDHLESKQRFLVKTQDGSVYSGTLRTVDSPEKRPMQIEISERPDHAVAIRSVEDHQNDRDIRNGLAAFQRADHFGDFVFQREPGDAIQSRCLA